MSKMKAYYKHELSGLGATATAAGYDVGNLLIFLEGSIWKGVGTGDHVVTFDAGIGKVIAADYIGVANHNLSGASFMLQYSDDNFGADINDAWDKKIGEFGTLWGSPQGIAYDTSDDTLWICDSAVNTIYNYKSNGTTIGGFLVTDLDPAMTTITGIAYAPDDTLWVCDANSKKIYNLEKDGSAIISEFATSVFDAFALSPRGISWADNGTLWVIDSATDKAYNIFTDGTWISEFPTSDYDALSVAPQDIAYAPDGTLWIGDSQTDLVYNVETDGTWISEFPTSDYDAAAIVFGGITYNTKNDTLWITDTGTDKAYNVLIATPLNNNPFLKEFDLVYARYWRIKLTDLSAVPFMGIAYWGRSVEWGFPALFDPNAEEDMATINESETGYLLGINIKFIKRTIDIKFRGVLDGSSLWLALRAWWDTNGMSLFFISWDIDNHPNDIYFVRPEKDFKGPFISSVYREVSLKLTGRVSK